MLKETCAPRGKAAKRRNQEGEGHPTAYQQQMPSDQPYRLDEISVTNLHYHLSLVISRYSNTPSDIEARVHQDTSPRRLTNRAEQLLQTK